MKNDFKDAAAKIVLCAGKHLKKNQNKIKEVRLKGTANLVTNLDREAEGIVITFLKKRFPDHGFLSEEVGQIKGVSGYRWVLDPLDGTTNFAHGFPFYAVSLALEKNDHPVLAVIYDPERDELFTAERRKGAYLNGKPIRVSSVKTLKDALLVTGFSYKLRWAKDNNIGHFKDLLFAAQAVRRAGSASLDLCYVACGRFDGFWEPDLHPWDTAAGWLIVKEAGGEVTDFAGGRYNPYVKQILATNAKIHKETSSILTRRRYK